MKVLIITWLKYNNYGTVLQAYALQKKIKLLGYDVKTLEDYSIGFDLIDKKEKNKFKLFFELLFVIFRYPFNKKNRLKYQKVFEDNKNKIDPFNEFKKKYIDIEHNALDKRYLNNRYQVFIAGSDQIWNPVPQIFSSHYYLDFVEDYNSKISYAPSMGQSACSLEMKKNIKPLLKDFEKISVREKEGQKVLKELTNKDISVVLDPTLLLNKEDWNRICTERLIKEEYIFCYLLSDNAWYDNYINSLVESCHLKLIKLTNKKITIDGCDKDNNIDPSAFISLIKNASYVVTDSYHGSIFSLIYEKEFVCLKRFSDQDNHSQNSRLYNLFKLINLNERFIDEKDKFISVDKKINYKIVKSVLKKEIKTSEEFLKNALENAKGNRVITSNCTSCLACYNACPVGAIKITHDSYGEIRPRIDMSKCIKCGRCKKVCPSNNHVELNNIKACLASVSVNNKEIINSTSGGIAYELCKQVLTSGGIVYGCIMDETLKARHIRIDNIIDLKRTQGSKYSQSFIGTTFKNVKNDLKAHKEVVFVGTPCQVAGLKSYLNKDYENLLLIDLVCHGNVPSPYISEYCKNIEPKATNVRFRNKRNYLLTISSKNKEVYRKKGNKDPYLFAFLKDISLKESCHHCIYAAQKRAGDITLGDFWENNETIPYSLVTLNTSKGETSFKKINTIKYGKNVSKSIKNNDSFNHPQGKNELRILFNEGAKKGFINGVKVSKLKRAIRREAYPKKVQNIIKRLSIKLSKIERGEF